MADIESGLLGAMDLLLEIKTEVKEIKKDGANLKEHTKILESYTNKCKREIISLIDSSKGYKKSIRLLHNIHTWRSFAYQEVLLNASDEIIKYGGIFFNGHAASNRISGCGRITNSSSFTRVALPSDIEFIEVFGGHTTFYALPKEGNFIYVWGMNVNGCAGVGHTQEIPIPIRVDFEARVKKIVCGKSINNSHQSALALCENGKVYVTGRNATGQLGTNNTLDLNTWTQNPYLSNIKDIDMACANGEGISLCIDNDGALFTFGHNAQGAAGNNTQSNVLMPYKQVFNERVKLAKASINNASGINSTSLILLEDGSIYGAGYNLQKQLSHAHDFNLLNFSKLEILDSENRDFIDIFPASHNATGFALREDGRVYAFGYGGYGFGNIYVHNSQKARPILENVKKLSVANHTQYTRALFLQEGGNLLAFGYNSDGALGIGNTQDTRQLTEVFSPKIKDFKLEYGNTEANLCVITEDGSFYASGNALDNNMLYSTPTLQKQF